MLVREALAMGDAVKAAVETRTLAVFTSMTNSDAEQAIAAEAILPAVSGRKARFSETKKTMTWEARS